MLGYDAFREPETRCKVKESEKKRFRDPSVVDRVYELYTLRTQIDFKLNNINRKMNAIQKDIGKLKSGKASDGSLDIDSLIEERRSLIAESDAQKKVLEETVVELEALRMSVGNILDGDVPVCKDESGNVTVRVFESERELTTNYDYASLMSTFTNSAAGAAVIGHRGYYLEGQMALLARALKNYAIDFLASRGYSYIQTPVMMRHEMMSKTAQLSDFSDQLYKVEDDIYLIATSEQPLTCLFHDTILEDSDLPKRYAGDSLCFRKEAGAHGKDNAGIFRVHQFDKIEQFVVCKPGESADVLEELIKTSEEFYKSLDISFRVVLIASGELNDAAAKKYDLEAYFPRSKRFRELVSASNCTDYQSRGLNASYGYKKKGSKEYVHMLNATMCAVQRALCCIVENYQTEGGIAVPDVLKKYTGFDFIQLNL